MSRRLSYLIMTVGFCALSVYSQDTRSVNEILNIPDAILEDDDAGFLIVNSQDFTAYGQKKPNIDDNLISEAINQSESENSKIESSLNDGIDEGSQSSDMSPADNDQMTSIREEPVKVAKFTTTKTSKFLSKKSLLVRRASIGGNK